MKARESKQGCLLFIRERFASVRRAMKGHKATNTQAVCARYTDLHYNLCVPQSTRKLRTVALVGLPENFNKS